MGHTGDGGGIGKLGASSPLKMTGNEHARCYYGGDFSKGGVGGVASLPSQSQLHNSIAKPAGPKLQIFLKTLTVS